MKVAVVMLNLGGPDSKEAIKPFLMNFFMDKNIIRLPLLFRWMLAKLISIRRSKREAGESYGELGDKSPLLENSQAQAKALQQKLITDGHQFKTFVCMRYWHPMSAQMVREVRDWGAEKIVIVPLYPQYSTTTTKSSLEQWNQEMRDIGMDIPTSIVGCYHVNEGFIKSSAANIVVEYNRALSDGYEAPRVLFSAHGLPEKIIKDGDPYQWQCEQGAAAIADAMGVENLDWQICYQSRVGRLKWIGPSVGEALELATADEKAVVIYPHAFTQEHVETLVELDIEYREEAEKMGQRGYYRARTVGTNAVFIDGLAQMVIAHLDKEGIAAEGGVCPCPELFNECCMRMKG